MKQIAVSLVPGFFCCSFLLGQSSISGVVREALTGASVPSADVTAMNRSRSIARTVTDVEGRFTFDELEPGQIELRVTIYFTD